MRNVGCGLVNIFEEVLSSETTKHFLSFLKDEGVESESDLRHFGSETAQRELRRKQYSFIEIGRIVEICEAAKARYDAVSHCLDLNMTPS
jgi:hypothetical protein